MSKSKSSAQMKPELAPFAYMSTDSLQTASQLYQSWFQGVAACNAEAAKFLGHRLQEDLELPAQFAQCHTTSEVLQVQTSFVESLMADYMKEAKKLGTLASKAVANGIEPIVNGHHGVKP